MNILIFSRGQARPRQLNLSGVTLGFAAVVAVASLSALAFAVGSWYSSVNGSGVSNNELQQFVAELDQQRAEIEAIRQQEEDTLDAMSLRLAELNARIIRLDALGRRLTDMADIDDGEFDFDSQPAMGGPEEPMQSGSIEVPELVGAMAAVAFDLD